MISLEWYMEGFKQIRISLEAVYGYKHKNLEYNFSMNSLMVNLTLT